MVWNHVETERPVSTVNESGCDHGDQLSSPFGSLARARHQYVTPFVNGEPDCVVYVTVSPEVNGVVSPPLERLAKPASDPELYVLLPVTNVLSVLNEISYLYLLAFYNFMSIISKI